MRTDFLWHELRLRAKLLDPTDKQLLAMERLAEIAIKTTPETVTGQIEVTKDQDGDLVITLQETADGIVVANGEWATLMIDMDGFCRLDGSKLDVPLYGTVT